MLVGVEDCGMEVLEVSRSTAFTGNSGEGERCYHAPQQRFRGIQ